MENQIVPIENRNFPITAKQLAIFIGGIISVIVTIMGTYYSIKSEIQDNAKNQTALVIEIKALREEQSAMKTDIKTLQFQMIRIEAQYSLKK